MKLLTWNTGLLRIRAFGRTLMEPAPYVEERAAHLAGALRRVDADIVALQEIYKARHKRQLVESLADLYPHVWHRRTAGEIRLDSGLMILSRWPIAGGGAEAFRVNTPEERWFTHRGLLWAEVTTPDVGRLRVVTFHATAGGVTAGPEAPRTDRRRAAQIDQILDVARRGGDGRVVLMGDLNAGPEASPANYRRLLDGGYVDLAAAAGGPGLATWDIDQPLNRGGARAYRRPQRIDHLLLPRDLARRFRVTAAEVVLREAVVPVPGGGRVPVSDHYGLACTLAPADAG